MSDIYSKRTRSGRVSKAPNRFQDEVFDAPPMANNKYTKGRYIRPGFSILTDEQVFDREISRMNAQEKDLKGFVVDNDYDSEEEPETEIQYQSIFGDVEEEREEEEMIHKMIDYRRKNQKVDKKFNVKSTYGFDESDEEDPDYEPSENEDDSGSNIDSDYNNDSDDDSELEEESDTEDDQVSIRIVLNKKRVKCIIESDDEL